MRTEAPSRRPAPQREPSVAPSLWVWSGLGRWSTLLLLLVLASIFSTGLATVDVTRQHRQMSQELEELRQQVYLEQEERVRLLLEISTFARADEIERIAREQLQMRFPAADDIVVVRNEVVRND